METVWRSCGHRMETPFRASPSPLQCTAGQRKTVAHTQCTILEPAIGLTERSRQRLDPKLAHERLALIGHE